MEKLKVLDLFSGIGGFSLGLERTGGFETVAFCEIEPFPRRVLAKHWPGVPCYEDVRELTGARLAADGITGIDVITGGFPCQDLSVAGRQAGMGEGTRSGLWSEIIRLVGELRPQFVIVENVANLLSGPGDKRGGWFGRVLGDLAECGYDAEWENIPASALGAPHRRERIWIVGRTSNGRNMANADQIGAVGAPDSRVAPLAYESSEGVEERRFARNVADTNAPRLEGGAEAGDVGGFWKGGNELLERCAYLPRRAWSVEPDVGRVANGVPDRAHRLAGLGNAVVPQIPELIGHAILASIRESEAA